MNDADDSDKHVRRLDPYQLLRYGLIALGTSLTTHGGMDDKIDQAMIEEVVGAIMTIASVCWGVYVRYKTAAVPTNVAAQSNIPVKDSLTGQVRTGPGV